jgi:hypothetical protein
MAETLTHIAGVRLDVCGRIIQRCSLCGAKLADSENCAMILNEDGSAPEFPTWQTGRLIQVIVGNPTAYIMLPNSDRLPDDSCIDLA